MLQHDVAEQPDSESSALHRRVDGETSEEDGWDVVAGHALGQAFCGVLVPHRGHRQGVVRSDSPELRIRDDEGAC